MRRSPGFPYLGPKPRRFRWRTQLLQQLPSPSACGRLGGRLVDGLLGGRLGLGRRIGLGHSVAGSAAAVVSASDSADGSAGLPGLGGCLRPRSLARLETSSGSGAAGSALVMVSAVGLGSSAAAGSETTSGLWGFGASAAALAASALAAAFFSLLAFALLRPWLPRGAWARTRPSSGAARHPTDARRATSELDPLVVELDRDRIGQRVVVAQDLERSTVA